MDVPHENILVIKRSLFDQLGSFHGLNFEPQKYLRAILSRGNNLFLPRSQAENDATKRARLRARLSIESDVYLGSVQAVCETGEVIGSDASGSRQAFYTYGPPRVIWVAGVNKLVPDVDGGVRRVREVALPLEDQRIRAVGGGGSFVGKLVFYERERPGRITLVLVGESLGF